jgi:FMN-dependent NADH-azoreductase
MTTVLQIKSSLFGERGQSSQLADAFTAAYQAAHSGTRLIVRDLAASPVPHLSAEGFGGFGADAQERTPAQRAAAELSDALIAEIRAADIVVIGLPMYNFGIPSALKAWFDHIARAGVTFRYTDNGAAGLLTGKRVVVFATRGGVYAGTPHDTQTGYVRDILRFLGMTDVQFVYAEGLALGEASQRKALAEAGAVIARIAQAERLAA